jgi:murein DD-endopeptidase MepM/ murein hydrolase activator NlpD
MSVSNPLTPPIDLTKAFSLEADRDRPADRAKIATMAQEFEAMLLLQMVRQMRQSMLEDEEEPMGLGNETMTDTFDVEFSRYLAKAGGIGLQRVIKQQIEEPPAKEATPTALPLNVAPTALPIGPTLMPLTPPGRDSDPGLAMPIEGVKTSSFGWRADPLNGKRKFHAGVDVRAAYGTEVPAAGAGTVTFAGERGGYGLMVTVEHDNGVETRYAHLASTAVQAGQTVAAGDVLGRVGSTGRSTGPHLHFEVLRDGERVDPEDVAVRRPVDVAAGGS